jgi:hypothetical protein
LGSSTETKKYQTCLDLKEQEEMLSTIADVATARRLARCARLFVVGRWEEHVGADVKVF